MLRRVELFWRKKVGIAAKITSLIVACVVLVFFGITLVIHTQTSEIFTQIQGLHIGETGYLHPPSVTASPGGSINTDSPKEKMLISIAGMVLWVIALIDCARREFPGDSEKLMWILIIALAGWIGAIIYWYVGRPKGTLAT